MKIEFTKKPKNVTIIEGFPGVGLIGTIVTEFLIDHLKAEKIGTIWFDDLAPILAIHAGKVLDPLAVYYSKKYNLVIFHALTPVAGMEWKIADSLNKVAKELKAKEIISVEGVGGVGKEGGGSGVFIYSAKNSKKWKKAGANEMEEGIIMGVTAALLSKCKGIKLSCIFAETASALPDSRASAKVIEMLDSYLGLKVDYKPLLEKAEEFEGKLKGLMKQTKKAGDLKEKKEIDYLG